MEPEIQNTDMKQKHPVFKVTTLSKYLALALFILMPFIGGYVGYVYAPEKIVEIQPLTQKEESPALILDNNTKIYNWGSENRYAVDVEGVYCLVNIDNKLEKHLIQGLDSSSFSFLKDVYVKDANGVYKVLCPNSDEVIVSMYEVSDIKTFEVVSDMKKTGPVVFTDKDFVYFSLPQEYSIEKNMEVDRKTFVSLGHGMEREIEGVEGIIWTTRNYYFKDKNSVFMIENGQLKKLEILPEEFDIPLYEASLML